MSKRKEPKNLAGNFLWAGVLALLGFVSPWFFLFAAGVAWFAWQEFKNPDDGRQPVGSGRRPVVDPQSSTWKDDFLAACDSPAEAAFLTATVEHFRLQPLKGLLKGRGLTLQLQVELGRYRVDFLANEWLVIEVDGAAWHSSPEAVKRDAERDACLKEDGFAVLRLPAKLVFNHPGEAMQRVKGALAAGRLARPERPKPEVDFGKALAGIETFIDEVNSFAERKRAVEQALRPARETVTKEQMLLQNAIDFSERRKRIDELCMQSPEHARHFDEAYNRIRKAIDSRGEGQVKVGPVQIPPLVLPATHADYATNEEIQLGFDQLIADRQCFFAEIRRKAGEEPRLEVPARKYLAKFGCEQLWDDAIGVAACRQLRPSLSPKLGETKLTSFGKLHSKSPALYHSERRGIPSTELERSRPSKPSA